MQWHGRGRAHPLSYLEDGVDRLNRIFTFGALLCSSVVAFVSVYFMHPLVCPMHERDPFKDSQYFTQVCWSEDKLVIQPHENKLVTSNVSFYTTYGFYQWAPFFLLFQAIFFYIPHAVWRACIHDILDWPTRTIMEKAYNAVETSDGARSDRLIDAVAIQLLRRMLGDVSSEDGTRKRRRSLSTFSQITNGRIRIWLPLIRLTVKILYLTNVLLQLYLVKTLLGMDEMLPNLKLLHIKEDFFPKKAKCEIRLQRTDVVQTYTVTCNLPVNVLLERIYTIFRVWIIFLLLVIIVNLGWVLMKHWVRFCQTSEIRNKLKHANVHCSHDPRLCADCRIETSSPTLHDFENLLIQTGNASTLELLENTVGYTVTERILCKLWHSYKSLQNADSQLHLLPIN
ncbi:unnamed protein product [Calicophoron daubneyi]|uniref:Innexin n=1 Tax=Calicophoron daubneyi TaxID=300641 RepID=A0AAV2T735_CALDB